MSGTALAAHVQLHKPQRSFSIGIMNSHRTFPPGIGLTSHARYSFPRSAWERNAFEAPPRRIEHPPRPKTPAACKAVRSQSNSETTPRIRHSPPRTPAPRADLPDWPTIARRLVPSSQFTTRKRPMPPHPTPQPIKPTSQPEKCYHPPTATDTIANRTHVPIDHIGRGSVQQGFARKPTCNFDLTLPKLQRFPMPTNRASANAIRG